MSASPDLWPSSPGPSRLPAAAPPTLPQVRAVTGDGLVESDGELLRLFTRHGDPAAFDKLVERHAAMVWRVCRQTLRRQQDAEDAFQATFLLLVKSARQIGASESAAGWLFRVAYRTSLRARKRLASRREEALALDPTAPSEAEFPDLSGRQTIATLAEELMELPMRYQTPLVMRYLEGQSRRAIAEATDVTVATVQGRLARGKQLLRRRLIRRGVSLAVAMSAVSAKPRAAAAAAPTQVVLQTTSNAVAITTGGSLAASAVVLTLLEQGTRAMLFASISKPMAVAAACGLAALVLAAPPVESNATVSDGVVLTAALDGDEAEAPTATLQLTADEPTSDGEPEASAPGVAAANDPPQVTGTVQTTSESPAVTATLQQSDPSLDSPDLRFGDMALNGRKLTDAEQNELLRKQWAEAAKKDPPPVDGEPSFKELHTWHTYWENRYDALRQQAEEMRIHREEGEGTATEGDIRLVAADIFKARAEALRYERELKLRALKDGEPGASATGGDAAKDIDDSMQTGDPIEQQSHDLDESLRLFEESIGAANRILTVARSVDPAMAESLHAAAAKSIDKAKSHRSMATQLFTTLVGDAALKDQEALRAAERYSRSLEDTKQRMEVVVSAYNQRNKNTSAAAKPRATTKPTAASAPPDPLLEWKTMMVRQLMDPAGYGLSRDDAEWFRDELMPNRHDSLQATIKINPYADATEIWEAWVNRNPADKEREVRVITAMIRNREAGSTTGGAADAALEALRQQNEALRRELDALRQQSNQLTAPTPADSESVRQSLEPVWRPQPSGSAPLDLGWDQLQPLDTNGRPGTYAAANQRYGHSVQQLQRKLNETLDPSPKLDIDGDYGPKTTAAVRKVQTKHGLKPTGFADEATLRAMGFLVPVKSSAATTTSSWSPQLPAAPLAPAAKSIPAKDEPKELSVEELMRLQKEINRQREALLELVRSEDRIDVLRAELDSKDYKSPEARSFAELAAAHAEIDSRLRQARLLEAQRVAAEAQAALENVKPPAPPANDGASRSILEQPEEPQAPPAPEPPKPEDRIESLRGEINGNLDEAEAALLKLVEIVRKGAEIEKSLRASGNSRLWSTARTPLSQAAKEYRGIIDSKTESAASLFKEFGEELVHLELSKGSAEQPDVVKTLTEFNAEIARLSLIDQYARGAYSSLQDAEDAKRRYSFDIETFDPKVLKPAAPEAPPAPEPPKTEASSSPEVAHSLQKGWRLFFARDERGAEEAFRQVLAADPGNLSAVNGLGFAVLNQGRPEEAKPFFEQIVAETPDAPGPLNGLARCLEAEGDIDAAVAIWERLVAAEPDRLIDPVYSLARVYEERGEHEKAKPLKARIAAEQPNAEEYRELLKEQAKKASADRAGAESQVEDASSAEGAASNQYGPDSTMKQGQWRVFHEPSELDPEGWCVIAELRDGDHLPVLLPGDERPRPHLKREGDPSNLKFRVVDPGHPDDGKMIPGGWAGEVVEVRGVRLNVSTLSIGPSPDIALVLIRGEQGRTTDELAESLPNHRVARRLLHEQSKPYDSPPPREAPAAKSIPAPWPEFPKAPPAVANPAVKEPIAARAPARVDYSDGKADGRKSLGGSGHLLRFELPEGALGVKAVRIHGSRYGTAEAPDEDFEIAFLSEDRSEILAVEHAPYGLFRRGPEAWTTVKFDKPVVDLPEKFWVAINFNPGRTKGVYFSYDTSTGGERSMTGTSQQQPDQHKPVDFDGDWMASIVLERE
ncbi:sigma-70 family RNA polymerase sigma factor [Botrimarina mediterranea]|uniref:sigma-70 family RNA polymerase sigma factor n=1 Tax=Botrimarina mediterranea TaxID=2528022 RepID=UPI001187D2BA|nr:ECF RNA polymerase sigma factor SigE [Planctomycetes bacterium K2D]